jgi:hypothetical protein
LLGRAIPAERVNAVGIRLELGVESEMVGNVIAVEGTIVLIAVPVDAVAGVATGVFKMLKLAVCVETGFVVPDWMRHEFPRVVIAMTEATPGSTPKEIKSISTTSLAAVETKVSIISRTFTIERENHMS